MPNGWSVYADLWLSGWGEGEPEVTETIDNGAVSTHTILDSFQEADLVSVGVGAQSVSESTTDILDAVQGSIIDDFSSDSGQWNLENGLSVSGGKLQKNLTGGAYDWVAAGRNRINIPGDFDLKVEIPDPISNVSQNLILVRLGATSEYRLEIYWWSDNGVGRLKNEVRDNSGTQIRSVGITGVTSCPRWLRFSRVGDVHTWYYSDDGSNWTTLDTYSTSLRPEKGTPILLYAEHYSASPAETVSFDNFSLTLPPISVQTIAEQIGVTETVSSTSTSTQTIDEQIIFPPEEEELITQATASLNIQDFLSESLSAPGYYAEYEGVTEFA